MKDTCNYLSIIPACISEEDSNQKLAPDHHLSEHVLSLVDIVLSSVLCVRQGWLQTWTKDREGGGKGSIFVVSHSTSKSHCSNMSFQGYIALAGGNATINLIVFH